MRSLRPIRFAPGLLPYDVGACSARQASRSSWQNRQIFAAFLIVSAHRGHGIESTAAAEAAPRSASAASRSSVRCASSRPVGVCTGGRVHLSGTAWLPWTPRLPTIRHSIDGVPVHPHASGMAEAFNVVTGSSWRLPSVSGLLAPLDRLVEVIRSRPAAPEVIAVGERAKGEFLSFEAAFRADLASRALVAQRAGAHGLPAPFGRLAEAAHSGRSELRDQVAKLEREFRPYRSVIRALSRDAGRVFDDVLHTMKRSAERMSSALEDVERAFRQLEQIYGARLKEELPIIVSAYMQAITRVVDVAGVPDLVLELMDDTAVVKIIVPVFSQSELKGRRRAEVLSEIEELVESTIAAHTDSYIVEFDPRGAWVAA